MTPYTRAEKFESFERINSIRDTNGNFDSCNSCKRLVPSRLHELHESKFPFVSRIEFIRSKLSNFSAHVYGVNGVVTLRGRPASVRVRRCLLTQSSRVSSSGEAQQPSQSSPGTVSDQWPRGGQWSPVATLAVPNSGNPNRNSKPILRSCKYS